MKIKFHIPDIKQIEAKEKEIKHFARGFNFYKLFWTFLIGCFLGVVVEMVFVFVTAGRIESRVGLIYGPFNLVYGFGALAMAIGLHWMQSRRDLAVMFGGVVIGTVVEYACSLVQELAFGSTSWDYSEYPFNLGGRVNLLYSLFWGVLAIVWLKIIWPFFASWIIRIPSSIGKWLTWVLLVFMIFNTIMSALAVMRWAQRLDGNPPQNLAWSYFDKNFPDDKMKITFPSMEFK